MTYKSYIKKDYKTKDGLEAVYQPLTVSNHIPYLFISVTLIVVTVFFGMSSLKTPTSVIISETSFPTIDPTPVAASEQSESIPSETVNAGGSGAAAQKVAHENIVSVEVSEAELYWESVKVKSGDNLALIFKRKRLSARMLHNIMSLGGDTAILKHLEPGQEIRFLFEDGQFEALQYNVDLTDILYVRRLGDIYSAEMLETVLETKVKTASGTIRDSLFLSGISAGLSDNMIMQLVNLYGWDIDFAMEVRKGDEFHIIYEERYKDGKKVQDGPILAAEFINRGKSFKAVRYTHTDGHSDYYAMNGDSMRKAFLRTPIEFSRISSRFSLGRKHPIFNKIRAHRGVDYAAPTGTPVRAAGDGVIKLAARKGGYGRTIIIQHGGRYTTLYGHLSRYAQGIRGGKHVKQGQITGYVGMTGLATGPHLHYEFRVNGVNRNPLTVKLPKALRISDELMDEFKLQTEPLLVQLNSINNKTTVAVVNEQRQTVVTQTIIVLNEKKKSSPLFN